VSPAAHHLPNLSTLLRVHEIYSNKTDLKHVLGDGYLYQHSQLYKIIRHTILSLGFKFSEPESDYNMYYTYFTLALLNKIYQTKEMPTKPTYTIIKKFYEANFVDFEVELEFIDFKLNLKNHILHESAHCIANHLLNQGRSPKFINSERNDFLLTNILAGEALANTLEFIFASSTTDAITRAFVSFNSYITYTEKEATYYKFLVEVFGPKLVFKFMFYSYLLCNYNAEKEEPETSDYIDLIQFLGLSNAIPFQLEKFSELYKKSYALNMGFRNNIANHYLKCCGLNLTIKEAYDFDIRKIIFFDEYLTEFLMQVEHMIFEKHLTPKTSVISKEDLDRGLCL
jgi:hypothetical protein